MATSLKRVKYEVISEALQGERECGDQYFIKELPEFTLLAVIDGLGHGDDAAHAAKKAIQTIDDHANEPIETVFKHCDEALHDTRGAAITIVQIDLKYNLSYMAIGNVTGVCWRIDEMGKLMRQALFLEGGIVGYRFPSQIHTKEVPMAPGDLLIMATDGIKIQFESEAAKLETPEVVAQHIFDTYRNKSDDGLILVAQLL